MAKKRVKKQKKTKKVKKPVQKKTKSNDNKPTKIIESQYKNLGFSVFREHVLDLKIDFTIIDGLYHRTILNKIIRKYTSSIVPPYFTLSVEDEQGNDLPELRKALKTVSRRINRKLLLQIEKEVLLYGTSVVYTGNLENEIFTLNLKDVQPRFSTEGKTRGQFLGFDYPYQDEIVFIPKEDVAIYTNDPDNQQIFGNSILEPMLQTLHEYLNNKLALAEILDNFSQPLLMWLVNTEDLSFATQDEFINKVKERLYLDLNAGDDVVADSRVDAKLVEFSNVSSHLVAILQESREDLGILSVPQALLGGDADNLSSSKVQVGLFYEETRSYQAELNDFIVENIYKIYLERLGYEDGVDYHNIYINFPPSTSELPSDSIIWVKSAFEMGLITLDEARSILGFRGRAPGATEELESYYLTKTLSSQQKYDDKNQSQTVQDGDKNDPYNKTGTTPKDGRSPDTKRD